MVLDVFFMPSLTAKEEQDQAIKESVAYQFDMNICSLKDFHYLQQKAPNMVIKCVLPSKLSHGPLKLVLLVNTQLAV